VGMPSGRASVPFPQRWRVAHGIPTLARGNEENQGIPRSGFNLEGLVLDLQGFFGKHYLNCGSYSPNSRSHAGAWEREKSRNPPVRF